MAQATGQAFEDLYDEHFDALVQLAVSRFSLSADEAEGLAHEILLASLFRSARIADYDQWLTGALTCAVRQRQRGARHA